jgi:hypothetical protein
VRHGFEVLGQDPGCVKNMSKKLKQTKAGEKTKGLFESGEVVTTQGEKPVNKTLVTSTMLPRSDPKSYWNTVPGIKRRIEMIQQNLKGTISGAKSTEATAKDAKNKIADLKAQLWKLEEGQ